MIVYSLTESLQSVTLWRQEAGSKPALVAVAAFVDSGYDSSADIDGSWTSDNGDSEWYGWQGALKQATANHPDREAIYEFIDSETVV